MRIMSIASMTYSKMYLISISSAITYANIRKEVEPHKFLGNKFLKKRQCHYLCECYKMTIVSNEDYEYFCSIAY